MPTLGPFFKWLRPNHWKHVAIGPKSIGNSRFGDAEALERVWPRPSKTPSDDTLLGGSAVVPEAAQRKRDHTFSYSEQPHPQDIIRVWMKRDEHGSRKGDSKNEMEMQERGTGSQSS